MAHERARVNKDRGGRATLTTPLLCGGHTTTITIGATTAVAIPTAPLSGRKGLYVTNNSANTLHLASTIPECLKAPEHFEDRFDCTKKVLKWTKAALGTNEYYASTPAGGDPGLTEPKQMYGYLTGSTIALLSNGTFTALTDHQWDWGADPTATFNTVYIADATGDPDASEAIVLLAYTLLPTTTVGTQIASKGSLWIDADSTVIILAIGSSTNTYTTTWEWR